MTIQKPGGINFFVVIIFAVFSLFINLCGAQIDSKQQVIYERVTSIVDVGNERELFVSAFMNAYRYEKDHFDSIGIFDMRHYFVDVFNEEFTHVEQELQMSSPIYFVRAIVNNEVVGFITFNEERSGQIYIRWLAVSPACGRHGIGKGLVDSIKKNVPDVRQLVLVTYKLDKPAMNFWKNKMSFVPSDYSRQEYDSAMFQGYTYNF
jgi:hypothetical protein